MNPADVDHFYFDGKHYDARTRIADIPFWIRQAERYGDPVLELAVGTGRVAIPLARAGFDVTGVDMSDSMLQGARDKCDEASVAVDLVKADIRDFSLDRKFALVLIPANTIVHLRETEELEDCLECVRRHLEPEGRLVIDTHHPQFRYLNTDWSKPSQSEYPAPSGDHTVVVTSTSKYDAAAQINEIRMTYALPGNVVKADTLQLRIHFPKELEAVLRYAGYTVDDRIGNYDGAPFHSGSEKQIVIASLA